MTPNQVKWSKAEEGKTKKAAGEKATGSVQNATVKFSAGGRHASVGAAKKHLQQRKKSQNAITAAEQN